MQVLWPDPKVKSYSIIKTHASFVQAAMQLFLSRLQINAPAICYCIFLIHNTSITDHMRAFSDRTACICKNGRC